MPTKWLTFLDNHQAQATKFQHMFEQLEGAKHHVHLAPLHRIEHARRWGTVDRPNNHPALAQFLGCKEGALFCRGHRATQIEDLYRLDVNTPLEPGDVLSWDVTRLVRAWTSGQVENHGLMLREVGSGSAFQHVFFASREHVDYTLDDQAPLPGPRLQISFEASQTP